MVLRMSVSFMAAQTNQLWCGWKKDKRDDGHPVRRIPWKRKDIEQINRFLSESVFSGVSIRD